MDHHTITFDVDRALDRVLEAARPVGEERSAIVNAFGRTLARPVVAEHDIPVISTALKDGFALRSRDTAGASAKLPRGLSILSESGGQHHQVASGTVVPIKAGETLPSGADAVVTPQQSYRPHDDPQILVMVQAKPADNVRAAGSLISKGESVISAGTVVSAGEMALLAGLAIPGVTVTRKPRVAIITTGAAVVDSFDKTEGGFRNIARYALVGMVLAAGCELGRLIHIRSGRPGIEKALSGCEGCDVAIVALGPQDKHDIAVAAIENAGTPVFERVQMQPGMMTAFGTVQSRPVFVIAAENALEPFEALIRPALLQMLGRSMTQRRRVNASLVSTLKFEFGARHYVRAMTQYTQDCYSSRPLPVSSPDSPALLQTNSLLVVPQDSRLIKRGEPIEAIMLD